MQEKDKDINKAAEENTTTQDTLNDNKGNKDMPKDSQDQNTSKPLSKKEKRQKKGSKNKTEEKSVNSSNKEPEKSKYDYVIKNRKIRKHTRQQKLIRIMIIFLAVSIVLGGGVYGMMTMIEYNNFKVLIDKEGLNILSLSHSEEFVDPTEVLSLEGPKYMDNITLMDVYHLLPEIEATEGNYGMRDKKNYVASTFYLKNVSGEDQYIRESIVINDVSKNVDDAIRIMVIRNSEKTVYAKAREDGEPEEVVPEQYFTKDGEMTEDPEEIWMTKPFSSPRHVFYETGIPLAAGEIRKYTIFIWLEGWDPECVNEILGGTIKLEFQFAQQAA